MYDALSVGEEMSECKRCAKCCKEFSTIVSGEVVEVHYGVPKVKLIIKHDCIHLTDGNHCAIYENRPKLCREFECWVRKAD